MQVAPLLDVVVAGEPGAPERTLVVAGELDLAAAPELERAVELLCAEGTRRLTIDLRRLTFMDCAGFATLVAASDFCGERGCETALLPGEGPARRLIKLIDELTAARSAARNA